MALFLNIQCGACKLWLPCYTHACARAHTHAHTCMHIHTVMAQKLCLGNRLLRTPSLLNFLTAGGWGERARGYWHLCKALRLVRWLWVLVMCAAYALLPEPLHVWFWSFIPSPLNIPHLNHIRTAFSSFIKKQASKQTNKNNECVAILSFLSDR